MLDEELATLGLRNRLIGLQVCTTGSITLAATTEGYTRAAGSFLDDGFAVGMELTPAGFAANPEGLIDEVSDGEIVLVADDARTEEVAASGRSLTVGLPSRRAWELIDFEPTPGRLYVTEAFLPDPPVLLSNNPDGGHMEESGLYVVNVAGLPNQGIIALRRYGKKIKERFSALTQIAAGSDTLIVRGRPIAPSASQVTPQETGWAICTITIPWHCFTRTAVVA